MAREPVPATRVVSMKVFHTVKMNTPATASYRRRYGATNYLYVKCGTPNACIGGATNTHPADFTMMNTLYRNFVVLGTKTFFVLDTVSTNNDVCGVIFYADDRFTIQDDDTNGNEFVRSVRESGYYSKMRTLASGHRGGEKKMTFKLSIPKFFNLKDIMDAKDYHGSGTTDPTKQAYVKWGCYHGDNASQVITFQIEHEFVILYWNPVLRVAPDAFDRKPEVRCPTPEPGEAPSADAQIRARVANCQYDTKEDEGYTTV